MLMATVRVELGWSFWAVGLSVLRVAPLSSYTHELRMKTRNGPG